MAMSKNAAATTAAIVGLVVGLAVGWVAKPAEDADPSASTKMRGGPPPGPTPTTVSSGIPPGTWSKVDCGDGDAVDMLDDIQELAITALDANQISPQMFNTVNSSLMACAINDPAGGGDQQTHCTMLSEAKAAAEQGQWQVVMQKMQHGHE